MSHWKNIRNKARAVYKGISEGLTVESDAHSFLLPAVEILKSAAQLEKLEIVPVAKGDPCLYGSIAMLTHGCILIDESVNSSFASYCQAHEFAHHFLHQGQTHCTQTDIEGFISEDAEPRGEGRISGYGPHEKREREANIFARELLLPCDALRHAFLEQKMKASDIAKRAGLPLEIVNHQLAYALLVSDALEVSEEANAIDENDSDTQKKYELDDSQKRAAEAESGSLLIEAGPGTGKTSTLVGRVLHLLKKSVKAENILCLTFSNKAAEEMRERVALIAPDAAHKIWMGTFHAFGLELLRKFWREANLPPKPHLLDPIDAIFMLERNLIELNLDYYKNLHEPTQHIGSILSAISRAKDELASPEKYKSLAQKMFDEAVDDEARTKAEKALEVARVYEFYQKLLNKEGLIDFGDLVYRSVLLLQSNKDVLKKVKAQYKEILVDEYQDVNRASGLLLRELVGDAKGLWAVGDARQSIYRWRGASPANMRFFNQDYPNADVLPLSINYRSQKPIVSVVSELAPKMHASRKDEEFTEWETNRKETNGKVSYEIAGNFQAEANYLAGEIRNQHEKNNISYKEQAVICRSHSVLNKVAEELEKANIPILYLGDIFERSEIRDLLSLLRLSSENRGRSLVRVARFPEYQIALKDVRRLIKLAEEKELTFPEAFKVVTNPHALADDTNTDSLSLSTNIADKLTEAFDEETKQKFVLLEKHLIGLDESVLPWKFLAQYLFDRSAYLIPYLKDNSVKARQKRFALYQFLQFAFNQAGNDFFSDLSPRHALLRYVRRLEMYGEEREYNRLPEWAEEIDAVRLLTIHGSKGLEFSAVYLPHLGQGWMPARRQSSSCPPPVGLIEGFTDEKQEHEEEEQCLFFVALSRAKDFLCFTRSASYGKNKSKPSAFLTLIEEKLPRKADSPVTIESENDETNEKESLIKTLLDESRENKPLPKFAAYQLDLYMNCPRQFYYEHVLHLSGKREDTAYAQFHTCVYETIRLIQNELKESDEHQTEKTLARFEEIWKEKGPAGHPYAPIYYEEAKKMTLKAVELHAMTGAKIEQQSFEVKLSNGSVYTKPDIVELNEDANGKRIIAHKIKTGRKPKTEPDSDVFGLYYQALKENYTDREHTVKVTYLATGDAHELTMSEKKINNRLANYEAAIEGISRREFPPKQNSQRCPSCAHYFICPSAE